MVGVVTSRIPRIVDGLFVELLQELPEVNIVGPRAGVDDKQVVVRTEGLGVTRRGDRVSLLPDSAALHIFDAESGDRVPAH